MDKRSSADELETCVDVQVAPACASATSEDRLRQVAEAVRRIETLFGSPQDVEWAIASGRHRCGHEDVIARYGQ